jgi:hypothetical protein
MNETLYRRVMRDIHRATRDEREEAVHHAKRTGRTEELLWLLRVDGEHELAQFTGWSCPAGPEWLVDWLVDRGAEVDFEEFAALVDVQQQPTWWEGFPEDWSASYLITDLPSGRKAWVIQHGGIEYLYTDDGFYDLNEGELATLAADWISEQDEYGDVGELPPQLLRKLRDNGWVLDL